MECLNRWQSRRSAWTENLPGAEILGVNFEAPFFTKAPATQWDRYPPAGYYAGKMARDPSVDELRLMQQAADGHIRLMTIAPELDGALEVIGEMCDLGIVPSIGHTAANFEQARAGVEAGAKSLPIYTTLCAARIIGNLG